MRRVAVWSGLLTLALTSGPTLSAQWAIDHSASRLAFVATWEDTEFDGVFKHFEARILFDANQLASSAFDVSVDVTTADSDSADRDAAMADPEWFHFKRYPRATFVTSSIRAVGKESYEAQGTLTIKGRTNGWLPPLIVSVP